LILFISLLLAAGPAIDSQIKRAVAEQLCAVPGASGGDDVVVCGNRQREERYRMPDRNGPFDPDGDVMSVAREHMSWGEGGETGPGSCGPVGPGGWTGCLVRQWKRDNAQTQYGKNRPKKY
jgi:hypothetical protein